MLLFAGLAEAVGRREIELSGEPDPRTVAELSSRLREALPALAGRPWRVAVNRRYASADDTVSPGDEVALIPPVSGGAC